ncbi:lysylphosphatidylglycerol synthase transmembrane domain-containing protein [Lactonifactor longoviformis]|uniref:lysylphosphatidylglycerol synthase transmembrane domain-containing protein n=1 Tax=Lactonifactor longoviformis TaxID=341220 RepID=UPI001D00C2D9|nr:lysylphosphatidylglycerol synthase transmembrane domain-containing protein [Lactonifactor longoviformis]MCB5713413.1 flippase-like domain-containing protein [Lactonifactor longoviformis]MCB5716715.1 flippase-like domain-containing protein [Lactonifactor longoviformis]
MKKGRKILLGTLPFLILALVLFLMFRNSFGTIWGQLRRTQPGWLGVILILGAVYQVLDAVPFCILIRRSIPGFTFWEALQVTFLGIFLNVTTFGTGIKPGQMLYLYKKKGADVGESFAVLILPYMFHKVSIMMYASIMLWLEGDFIRGRYPDNYHYLYTGYGLSFVIVVVLILVCASDKFHKLLFRPLDAWIKKESWKKKIKDWKEEISKLQKEAHSIVRSPSLWVILSIINLVKLSLWYVIPLAAVKAVGAGTIGVKVPEILATSSFMQLIVGVIPVTGGMGATEVVYQLLYGVLFGEITAGSTMILYRMANYYVPFLVSIGFALRLKTD